MFDEVVAQGIPPVAIPAVMVFPWQEQQVEVLLGFYERISHPHRVSHRDSCVARSVDE